MMNGNSGGYHFGDVVIDQLNLRVTVNGEVRPLEPKSFRVLEFLVENGNRAVSKDEIIKAVWVDTFVTDNALTRAIAQIRKAIDDDPRVPRYIETVPTVGYRFIGELREPDPPVTLPATSLPHPLPRRNSALILGGALMIAAVGLLAWKVLPRAPQSEQAKVLVSSQFSTSDGLDVNATFSRDGQLVAYASDRSGAFEIYVRSLKPGGREIKLTDNGNQNLFPSFSPDGQSIVFSATINPGLYRVPVLGGTVRRLTEFGAMPSWSPDGRLIVFRSSTTPLHSVTDYYFPPASTLWLVSAEGGAPQEITNPAKISGGQSFPSWSADSKQIRFVNCIIGQKSAIWTYTVATRALKLHFESSDYFGSATFSPDDRNLYYIATNLKGDVGIWRLPLDPDKFQPTGPPVVLYQPSLGVPRDLSISPDGKRLAYSALLQDSKIMLLTMKGDLPNGDEPVSVTPEISFRYIHPHLLPNGNLLAYTRWNKSAEPRVWLMELPNGTPQPIGDESESQYNPSFHDDENSVMYLATGRRGQENGNRKWRRVRLSDGSITDLMPNPSDAGQIVMRSDGAEVLYHRLNTPLFQVYRLDGKTGVQTQLTFGPHRSGYPRYSNDGKWIMFAIEDKDVKLAVMPSSGGKAEVILNTGINFGGGWSPDDSKLLYAAFVDSAWNLFWIDRKTKKSQPLTSYSKMRTYVRYPHWAKSGNRLVYEYGEIKGNVFLADLP